LIPDSDVVVTITRGGYAKRTNTDLYRVQKRGGKGVRGAALRTDDEVDHLFATTNHHWILFFTNKGRVYRARSGNCRRPAGTPGAATSPACSPSARRGDRPGAGDPGLSGGGLPAAGHQARLVKKSPLPLYDSPRQAGIIAVNFRDDDDELIGADCVPRPTRCC
jgi:DNA gyrase subunit A